MSFRNRCYYPLPPHPEQFTLSFVFLLAYIFHLLNKSSFGEIRKIQLLKAVGPCSPRGLDAACTFLPTLKFLNKVFTIQTWYLLIRGRKSHDNQVPLSTLCLECGTLLQDGCSLFLGALSCSRSWGPQWAAAYFLCVYQYFGLGFRTKIFKIFENVFK